MILTGVRRKSLWVFLFFLQTVTVIDLTLALTLTLTNSRSTTENPGASGRATSSCLCQVSSFRWDSSRKLRNGGGGASRHANRKQTEERRLRCCSADEREQKSGGRPVDERVPHAGGDGRGLRRVAQSEDALDDRQLRAGGLQAAERTPVVDHHPRRDHLTAPVDGARLDTTASRDSQHANRTYTDVNGEPGC